MSLQGSGRQGQLIIWAAAEARRLRRLANGTDGAGAIAATKAGCGPAAGGRLTTRIATVGPPV